jgi:hypothetical protein
VPCASLWIGAPLVPAGLLPRRDSFGYQICELCSARLNRVKHHRPYGVGRACKACLVRLDRGTPTTPVVSVAPVRSHKRKAESDPGEQQTQQQQSRMQTITRRILPLPPTEHALPRAMRSTERIARQLEETHARRMAAMESALAPAQE